MVVSMSSCFNLSASLGLSIYLYIHISMYLYTYASIHLYLSSTIALTVAHPNCHYPYYLTPHTSSRTDLDNQLQLQMKTAEEITKAAAEAKAKALEASKPKKKSVLDIVMGRDPNDMDEEEVLRDADDDTDVKKSWADILAGEDRSEIDFAGAGDIRKLGVSGMLDDDEDGWVL